MNIENSFKCIDIFFRDNPSLIVKHHLDSYNKFFRQDLKNIMIDNNPKKFVAELDKETNQYRYTSKMYFGGKNGEKIYYGKPIIYDKKDLDERTHYMFPNEARLRNMTYYFTIHYDIDIEFTILVDKEDGEAKEAKFQTITDTMTIEKVLLGKFPLMVKSYLCLLNNLPKSACYNLGECRNDKGGYFIINGKEKAIVSQEGRANNILYIKDKVNDLYSHSAEIRSVSEDASKPIRTLSVRIVADQTTTNNKNIVVNVPNVRKPVPLFILMRALGIISDKEIIETCLLDMKKHNDIIDLFIPSVYDAGNIFTQQAALKYIATLTKGKTIKHVMGILMDYFLPHIGELNFKHKALYLGYIVKRLLLVFIKAELPTNRDKYTAKRIEHTGILLAELFREYYKKELDSIHLKIDKEYFFKRGSALSYQNENFPSLFTKNKDLFFSEKLVQEGFNKAFKGNWGAEVHTKRVGVVQSLNRLSFFSFMCQLRKTNLHIGDSSKSIEPRLINATQYGLLCPLHSPDGGNVGLHKHLATSVHITNGVKVKPYINYLKKINMILIEECSKIMLAKLTKIFINGAWVGCTKEPTMIVNTMKIHRRNNLIYLYSSILFDIKRNEIQIWLDAGRLCRPLFYIDAEGPSFKNKSFIDKFNKDDITWNDMTCGFNKKLNQLDKYSIYEEKISDKVLIENRGIIDYVDAFEGEGMKLMKSTTSLEDLTNETHIEIHPSLTLGFMANQIIFPENNPYPRNAFSCGQAKQGVSLYSTNFQNRIDKSSLILNYGQTPLTKSRYLKHFTNEEHPYGENAIVAIMCYSGYNVEDAVIINEGSLKRGLFSTTYYNAYEDREESSNISSQKVNSTFMNIEDNNVLNIREGYDYSKLDKTTGLIKEDQMLNEKTIVIGKATNSLLEPDMFVDSSVKCKKGQTGLVDKSFITEGEEGQRIAKVRVRSLRIPQIGDKFCSRAGQKGTIGIVLPESEMPFTEDGLKPDIIVNPHAMPSRMTIGHLVEALLSKTASIIGSSGDCTAFINKGPKDKIFGKVLSQNGFHSSGNEILYNGMTGEQLETEIYIGPTYYLRLKHMPKDKINYRARGPRTVLTRQTVGGRANDGGLRIGEMDRDCLIAHGMSGFVKESMMVRGDQYYMAICNQTGTIAAYNETRNLFLSPMADGPLKFVGNIENEMNIIKKSYFGRDFSIIKVPYAFKLLMQELKTMNIQMRIITENNIDKLTTLVEGEKINIFKMKDLKKNKKVESVDSKEDAMSKTNDEVPAGSNSPDYDAYTPEFDAYNPDMADSIEDEFSNLDKNIEESSKNEDDEYGDFEVYNNNVDIAPELEGLSENLQIGGKVKIRTGRGISKGNFTVLGYSLRSNEYTLQSLESGELTVVDKKNIITKFSSLEDPNKLKISEDINLDVDELPAMSETFTLDESNSYNDEDNNVDDDEVFADDQWYPKQLTEEELQEDDDDEEKEVRTVEKISTDDTNKSLRLLAYKEEEKDDGDTESDKSDIKKTTIN